MYERIRVGFAITAAMVLAAAVASPVIAASSETNADALAQKFIDGPKREAQAADHKTQLEELRLKELDVLSAKLKKARESRLEQDQRKTLDDPLSVPGLRGFSQLSEPVIDEPETIVRRIEPQRVAVLLALQPGRRSSRRFERTAEPIICLEARCYIGAGPARDAKEMPRRKALGPGNALSARAGACRQMPRCIFRNIPVSPAQALLQPVDLGWIRHDRRKPVAIAADETCRVEKQRLSCEHAVIGPDYRVWLVPEDVARKAGSQLLQQALAQGLRATGRRAALN